MGRRKGSLNKQPQRAPETLLLTTEQRVDFLANLIVDRITEDQTQDQKLLKRIKGKYVAGTTPA